MTRCKVSAEKCLGRPKMMSLGLTIVKAARFLEHQMHKKRHDRKCSTLSYGRIDFQYCVCPKKNGDDMAVS